MKRFLTILVVAVMAIGSVSAQKKVVEALTTEVEALKQQNGALSNEVEALKQQNAELQQQINDAKAREKMLQAKCDTLAKAYAQVEKLSAQVEALSDVVAKAAGADKVAAIVATAEKPKYEVVGEVHNGMVVVKEGFLYGYVNSKNEYVIKAKYEEVKDFVNGYAWVRSGDKWGVVNKTGKMVVSCTYDVVEHYNKDIYVVQNNGLYGLISATNGAIIQPVKYSMIGSPENWVFSSWDLKYKERIILSHDRARMCLNDKWGYFDENGRVVIPAKYAVAWLFRDEGLAYVKDRIGERGYNIDKSGNYAGR